ncbi:Uncharacterised protein [Mycobacteroides abscessus subsp. abscessus]|uniref:TPR repeat region-containing protein n=2 Tax=Mycobacteroides abscessus TaxID=36809 RepID=UPI000925D4ED|nr:hypothetical protein [Mycobacteroides abscessus]SHU93154.1 Uncharacterised protein [Mycobacteroides abscessus subsp. abscessus]SHX72790.1 Uncharacterised protein [Mycobacteroides abscessus subsp. abscessus]SIG87137.1 Uncharacterised protein [Mycobacteroides abscessus subsp. abscessus]SKD18828.1 Uncharacterised protein [Mycobacteroides abscessus subsp. abscessus]SKN10354.1 Uncharacterised protein [Mycobacteroides abscessus subsp. abscessus]
MTGVPLAQGRKMPESIQQLREAAQERGKNLGKASDETAAIRNASTQQGAAGDAAREALSHSVTTFDGAKMKAHELALDAWMAENHAAKVRKDIEELVAYADARPACHIDEIANTVTHPVRDDHMTDQEWKDAKEKKYPDVQNRMLQVVAELKTVCEEFAAAIKEATDGEIPPGVREGAQDAQAVKTALKDGKPIPAEVLDRIGKITNLSEADKKPWEAGRLTIPQSSMDYLNSFSRSLDGQNIQQLKDMMLTKMPEGDAKNVMNGLQMISDPKVQAPGPNGMKGSFDRLPDGIKNVAGNTPALEGRTTVGQFQALLDDRKDLATIMSSGTSDFMHGSELDRAVLKQADQLLDKMPGKSWSSGDGALNGPIKDSREAIQSMLSAAGRDNMAVHDLVAGVDGHTPNDRFIGELMKQDWNDDGRGDTTCFIRSRTILESTKLPSRTTSSSGGSMSAIMTGQKLSGHSRDLYRLLSGTFSAAGMSIPLKWDTQTFGALRGSTS